MDFYWILRHHNLTQKELAKELSKVGCYKYQQDISSWCNGKRKPDLLSFYYLTKVLNISADELLKSFFIDKEDI